MAETQNHQTIKLKAQGIVLCFQEGGEIAQLVKALGYPGDNGANHVAAITLSCAAIHFSAVYNLQHHQRPVPLIPCLFGAGG